MLMVVANNDDLGRIPFSKMQYTLCLLGGSNDIYRTHLDLLIEEEEDSGRDKRKKMTGRAKRKPKSIQVIQQFCTLLDHINVVLLDV